MGAAHPQMFASLAAARLTGPVSASAFGFGVVVGAGGTWRVRAPHGRWSEHAPGPHEDRTHFLAHLAVLHPRLFVTSCTGAVSVLAAHAANMLAAHAAAGTAHVHVVGVCDAATLRLTATHQGQGQGQRQGQGQGQSQGQGEGEGQATYSAHVVERDAVDVSPADFFAQFFPAAVDIARQLTTAGCAAVVVHCDLGVNRSCAALLMACVLLQRPRGQLDMVHAVEYVRRVNGRVRCTVLTNDAYVQLLVTFAQWSLSARAHLSAADFADFVRRRTA